MGSWSQSITEDNRLVAEGAEQVTAPHSQIANPLGINITQEHSTGNPTVDYGGITIDNWPDDVNELVRSTLKSNQDAMKQMTTPVQSLVSTIEGIKTPLAQYVPYAVIAAVSLAAYLVLTRSPR